MSYDRQTHSLITDAPLPHARPYLFNYDDETGMPLGATARADYNGGYNGFWLVTVSPDGQERHAEIKNMTEKRTRILLNGPGSHTPEAGHRFEIRLLAPGDELEIPVWGEARRGSDGQWQIGGPARASVRE